MDPGTIAIVLGTGISALGQLQAGINARNNANINAKSLFDLANADRLAGIENRKRQKRANLKLAGMNRAIDPDKLDLLEDNAIEGALLEADITHAANLSALQKENQARAQIAFGQQAFGQGVFGAFSSTLIGAGTAFGGVGSPLQTADTRSVFRLS
jgi:hypothetical protein